MCRIVRQTAVDVIWQKKRDAEWCRIVETTYVAGQFVCVLCSTEECRSTPVYCVIHCIMSLGQLAHLVRPQLSEQTGQRLKEEIKTDNWPNSASRRRQMRTVIDGQNKIKLCHQRLRIYHRQMGS